MKFMKEWFIAPEFVEAAIKRFEEAPEPMEGIKQLGRWTIAGTDRGYQLLETDDLVALAKYNLYWADLSDQKMYPVTDDDESAKSLGE